jgi:RNA exonuclease 1
MLTGHSDPRHMLALAARRQRFEKAYRALKDGEIIAEEDRWTTEDDRELESAVAAAREGMAFFCVK